MVNVQVRNSETMSLNVEFHIAELQLIPRAVYERRNYGGPLPGNSGGLLPGERAAPGRIHVLRMVPSKSQAPK